MPTPTMLLRPEGSVRNGSPYTVYPFGSTPVVAGQHGQTWNLQKYVKNNVLNPSFETNTNFTTALGGATLTRSSLWAASGNYSLQVACPGGGAHEGVYIHSQTDPPSGFFGSGTFRGQAVFRGSLGQSVHNVFLRITYTDGTYTDSDRSSVPLNTNGIRVFRSVSPAAGKTISRVDFYAHRPATSSGSFTFWVDAVQIEQRLLLNFYSDYADGSLGTGYAWEGTAHNSRSTRRAAAIVAHNSSINPQVGTIIIRYRKIYEDPTGSLFAIGTNGNGTFLNVRTVGNQVGATWKEGSGANRDTTNPPALVVDSPQVAAVRWNGAEFDTMSNGVFSDRSTRDVPAGWGTSTWFHVGTEDYLEASSINTLGGLVESVLVFPEELPERIINQIANINGAWTWQNISDVGIVTNSASLTMRSTFNNTTVQRTIPRSVHAQIRSTLISNVVVRTRRSSLGGVARLYMLNSQNTRRRTVTFNRSIGMTFQSESRRVTSVSFHGTATITNVSLNNRRLRHTTFIEDAVNTLITLAPRRYRYTGSQRSLRMTLQSTSFVITEYPRFDAFLSSNASAHPVRRRRNQLHAAMSMELWTKVPVRVSATASGAITLGFQNTTNTRVRTSRFLPSSIYTMIANGIRLGNFNSDFEPVVRQRSGFIHFVSMREAGDGHVSYVHEPTEEDESQTIFVVTNDGDFPILIGWAITEWHINRVTIETTRDVFGYPEILERFQLGQEVQS